MIIPGWSGSKRPLDSQRSVKNLFPIIDLFPAFLFPNLRSRLRARRFWCSLAILLDVILGCQFMTRGQVLFDGSSGGLPATQGWVFFALGDATQTPANEAVLLETSFATATQAGYSLINSIPLNRTNGFTVGITAQIHSESHANANRAGFSLILLDNDLHGLELGFWSDRIFAQADSPLFVHAEDVAFPTTNSFVDYRLSFFSTNYFLRAEGATILRGPIRNYTAFSGFPNPYRTPNFIFLGDDTTSASAAVSLREVVVFTPPILEMVQPGVVSWKGVPGKAYLVQSSGDLAHWVDADTVTSASGVFYYTNGVEGGTSFLRVVVP
jgi:hypothetical protein